jgi:hypothetical protein
MENGGTSMLPVVVALQTVVVVQIVQAVALIVATIYLLRKLAAVEAERSKREQAQARALTAELSNLEATVRAARAETATYLEAVFTGVRGLAQNLDAARTTSAQTLEELKRTSPPPNELPLAEQMVAPSTRLPPLPGMRTPPPPPAEEAERPERTLEDPRPVRLVETTQPRRKAGRD